jgi:diaminopimelate decarboxylase
MSKLYEKPSIHRLQSGLMNKFSGPGPSSRRVRGEIDGVAVKTLTEQFGSPLFVFSERRLRNTVRRMKDVFQTRYPKTTFGWSYKTNFNKAICALMHQEGSWAEVVSTMEYQKARELGMPANRIIFNGPHKPRPILEEAIGNGSLVNVDHIEELEEVERIAIRLGRVVTIGLRLNLDAGIEPRWSRFGFNLENGQAMDAAARIARNGKVVIGGLHCHIGTFIMDASAYSRQVSKMVKFGYQLQDSFGFEMAYINVGGGLPSKSRLKGSYHAAEVSLPPLEEYADEITYTLKRELRPGHEPRLFIESGRAMVDDAGSLITSVCGTKRLADGTRAYVLDAGVNLLFTSYWYRFDIALAREVPGPTETSVLYGPLCMNIDVVDDGLPLPPLSSGDQLVVSPVGAYNMTQSMQFIEFRPNAVMIGMDGGVDLIREAEDLSDIERRERLPQRLAGNPFNAGVEPVDAAATAARRPALRTA